MPILRKLAALIFFAAVLVAAGLGQQQRPAVTGISHMCVYAQDMGASRHFYVDLLDAIEGDDPQSAQGRRYYFSPHQFVEVLPLPANHTLSRMACTAWQTADARDLRLYLLAHGVTKAGQVSVGADGSRWFSIADPEGNPVEFLQAGRPFVMPADARPVSSRIIHVGYVVHEKSAEDRFYRDALGYKPYWFGAMQPDRLDWVSQQVPDGTDWLEYMLVGPGSDVPLDRLDANQLGVLNHFSLGVANMEQVMTRMIGEERLSPRHDGPQMGKDGKWQANVYDPDGTRVELMEFQPSVKPCCSSFTSSSPTK